MAKVTQNVAVGVPDEVSLVVLVLAIEVCPLGSLPLQGTVACMHRNRLQLRLGEQCRARIVHEVGILAELLLASGAELFSHLPVLRRVGLDSLEKFFALALEVSSRGVVNLRHEGHLLLKTLLLHSHWPFFLGRSLHVLGCLEHTLLHHHVVHQPLCLDGMFDVRRRNKVLFNIGSSHARMQGY